MFTVRATSSEPPSEVWSRVTDFAAHAQGVPFTSATTDPGDQGVGWRFSARTGIGPMGFDDPMVMTVWEPPHRVRVEKRGRVLAGWADISLSPLPGGGTEVVWREEVVPAHRGTARLLRPLFDTAGSAIFGRALRAMVAPP